MKSAVSLTMEHSARETLELAGARAAMEEGSAEAEEEKVHIRAVTLAGNHVACVAWGVSQTVQHLRVAIMQAASMDPAVSVKLMFQDSVASEDATPHECGLAPGSTALMTVIKDEPPFFLYEDACFRPYGAFAGWKHEDVIALMEAYFCEAGLAWSNDILSYRKGNYRWARFAPRVDFVRHAGMFMRYVLDTSGTTIHAVYKQPHLPSQDGYLSRRLLHGGLDPDEHVLFKAPEPPQKAYDVPVHRWALTLEPVVPLGALARVSFQDFEALATSGARATNPVLAQDPPVSSE